MPRYYIEAFNGRGAPILGNLDGQAALGNVKAPERCKAWQRLGRTYRYAQVKEWRIVNEGGGAVATKLNPEFVPD